MAFLAVALIAAGCAGANVGATTSPLTAAPSALATGTPPITAGPAASATPDASPSAAPTPPPASAAAPAPTSSPTISPEPSAATTTYPLTLVDDEQNRVVLPAEPVRIVSITPATTEILFALGVGDRLIANTDADDYPPAVTSLPHVATYSSVDVERIVSLNAQLVIAGGNGFNAPDSLAQLRRLGIPVLVVYGADVEGVLHDIDLVSQAVGRPAQGLALIASMRAGFAAVGAATRDLVHPRTFYELDATKEIYGPTDDSFIAEMIALAGGLPITTGSTTVFSIPLERLVAADPEVIVLGDAAYGTTPELAAARPGWATMTAVKNGAIRPVEDTIVTRPGPRLVEGLRALALAIHPGLVLPALPDPSSGTSARGSPGPSAPGSSASGSPGPSST